MKNIMMKIEEKINKNKVIYLVIIIMILLIIGTLLYKVNSNRLKANIIKAANESGFNDVNFYSCVIKNYNVLNNASLTPEDILSNEQLKTITSLSCDGSNTEDKIKNVNGLEKLVNLVQLNLNNNSIDDVVDLSNNALLEEFKIENNKLIKLDLRQNTKVNYFSSDLEINIVEGNSKLLSDILLLPNSSNLKIENENIATLNKQNDDYIINGIISGKTYLKVTNENDSSYQIEINVANDVKLISKKTKDNDDTKEKQAGNTRVINNLKNDNMLVRKEKSIVNILVIILLVISFLMLSFSTYLVLKIRKTR